MDIKNLAQLKRAIKVGTKIQTVEHFDNPLRNGMISEVTKVQTNGFYFRPIGEVIPALGRLWEANGGLGLWVGYGTTKDWAFCGVVQYKNYDGSPIVTYRILSE